MTEISYPFDADNANGGSQVVSQTQWQQMAANWTTDHVDFRLTSASYTSAALPLNATVSGRTVTVQAGSAWVGGFYYKLTGTKSLTIADNTTSQGRIDMIVLRLDMSNSAVQLAVVQGTPAATPVEPQPTRQIGGVWEMPLHAATVPANNGTVTLSRRTPFPAPTWVVSPFNAAPTNALMPKNGFVLDADSDVGSVQTEYFNGRDGHVATRTFGKSTTYTPNTLYVSGSLPTANRKGRWRWIAPNTYWVSVTLVNDYEDQGISVSGSNTRIGVSLPVNTNNQAIQTLHGYLSNPYYSGGLPNMMAITATTQPGSNILYLHYPNPNTLAEGLDGLRSLPARSTFSISGVLEANQFS
ncbi:hypothetical protein AB0E08_03610 [Streptomyces sp. NPDC048281]|uniref:hypothetical protein n=1 Tax=Streptomyces sp. NPDC048281 TaxID=3154715 RepID=UPI0034123DE0